MRHKQDLLMQAAFDAVVRILGHLPPDDALRVIADAFNSILLEKEEKNHHPDVTFFSTE